MIRDALDNFDKKNRQFYIRLIYMMNCKCIEAD